MKRTAETTTLTFVLDNEQTLQNIDHLKLHDYERFKFVNHLGTELLAAAKDNDVVLHNLIRNYWIVFSKSIICSSPSSNCKSKILSSMLSISGIIKQSNISWKMVSKLPILQRKHHSLFATLSSICEDHRLLLIY